MIPQEKAPQKLPPATFHLKRTSITNSKNPLPIPLENTIKPNRIVHLQSIGGGYTPLFPILASLPRSPLFSYLQPTLNFPAQNLASKLPQQFRRQESLHTLSVSLSNAIINATSRDKYRARKQRNRVIIHDNAVSNIQVAVYRFNIREISILFL